MDITKLSISSAKKMLQNKEITATELLELYFARIEKAASLNIFTSLNKENALAQAKIAQNKYDDGSARALEGIPVAVKDLFCTYGISSTSCSKILSGFKPRYESTVTSNLFANGAIMVGKTNMDEFAMGSSNITSHYGPVISPLMRQNDDAKLVPGGSSGGSSAAIAASLALAALGSDTGGSIRQPASFTGTVGIKPTYGRCSRWGMIAFASSLDQAGVFGKNVEDASLCLEAIMGYDEKDSTVANIAPPSFANIFNQDIKGLKIGIPKEYNVSSMPKEIKDLWQEAAKKLASLGCEIIDISLPHTEYALSTYYVLACAEASSNLARYDGVRYAYRAEGEGITLDQMYEKTRSEGFGTEVKRRIMLGTYVLSSGYFDAYYNKAKQVRRLIYNDFMNAYEKVDVILTPTTPSGAFAIGENTQDPVIMYLNDIFTVPASLAGLPSMSMPGGVDSQNMPLGLHLIAKPFDETGLIKVASRLESEIAFDLSKIRMRV